MDNDLCSLKNYDGWILWDEVSDCPAIVNADNKYVQWRRYYEIVII